MTPSDDIDRLETLLSLLTLRPEVGRTDTLYDLCGNVSYIKTIVC